MIVGTRSGRGVEELRWISALIFAELIVVYFSIRLRNPYLALIAWAGAGIACCCTEYGKILSLWLAFRTPSFMGIAVALAGVLLTEILLKKRFNSMFSFLAAVFLVINMLNAFGTGVESILHVWIAALVLMALAGALAWRAGNMPAAGVLCFPMLRQLYFLARNVTGWGFVMLSFPLLALGAYLSLKKGRPETTKE